MDVSRAREGQSQSVDAVVDEIRGYQFGAFTLCFVLE